MEGNGALQKGMIKKGDVVGRMQSYWANDRKNGQGSDNAGEQK
jgi:hypothetical protein